MNFNLYIIHYLLYIYIYKAELNNKRMQKIKIKFEMLYIYIYLCKYVQYIFDMLYIYILLTFCSTFCKTGSLPMTSVENADLKHVHHNSGLANVM